MKASVTYTDEKRPSGVILRTYYRRGVHASTVCINAGAGTSAQAAARDAERRFLGSAPASSAAPRVAPAGEGGFAARRRETSLLEPAPKNARRLAREALYQTCFDQSVTLDTGDQLSREHGSEAAAMLIRRHGKAAAWASMTSRYWAARGLRAAPPIPRTTAKVVGEDRAAAFYKRRAQALTEPGRECTSDAVGTEGYAADVYASRGVSR